MAKYWKYEEVYAYGAVVQLLYKTIHRSRMELQTIEERSFQASVDQEIIKITCHPEPGKYLEPERCLPIQVAPGSIPQGESAGGECGC